MSKLIVTFKGGDEYNKAKQLIAISERKHSYYIDINDYDELDKLCEAAEGKIRNLVVIHPDNDFDYFENILQEEYGNKFNIEVLPEQFYRLDKLNEADTATATQNNLPFQEGGKTVRIWILPWNPPVKGAVNNYTIFQNKFRSFLNPNNQIINIMAGYQPPSLKDNCWCSSAFDICKRFKGGEQLKNGYYITNLVTLFDTLATQIAPPTKTGQGDRNFVFYPLEYQKAIIEDIQAVNVKNHTQDYLVGSPYTSLSNIQTSRGARVTLPVNLPNVTEFKLDLASGKQAYDLGHKILDDVKKGLVSEKSLVDNDKSRANAEKWLNNTGTQTSPMFAKRKFLFTCLKNIDTIYSMYNPKSQPQTSDKWKQFMNQTWKDSGAHETAQTIQQNIDNMGGGLFLDAIKIATNFGKTVLEKENKKEENTFTTEQLCIFHQDWDTFANLFDSEDNFQPLQEDNPDEKFDTKEIIKNKDENNDESNSFTRASTSQNENAEGGETDESSSDASS